MAITIDPKLIFGKIKQPKVWATAIMAVLLVIGVWWWWVAREKRNRDAISSRDNLIAALNVKWLACINAPADTTYHHVVVVGGPSQTVYPKPKRLFGVKVDTTKVDSLSLEKPKSIVTKDGLAEDCPKGYYNDTTYTDNFSVNWEAMGCIRSFRLLKVSLDHDYMVIKKNQVVIQYDTAWLPAVPKKWHWGLEGQVFLNDFKSMPGLGGGVFVIFQEKLQLGIGPAYFNDFGGYLRLGYIIK